MVEIIPRNEPFERILIDYDDYLVFGSMNWTVAYKNHNKYAKNRNDYLHILIYTRYNLQPRLIDHIDGNGLNNQRNNLREVNYSQNSMNSKTQDNTYSGVKGVVLDKRRNIWMARIKLNGVTIDLGSSPRFEVAVKLRKRAEKKYFGEYARQVTV